MFVIRSAQIGLVVVGLTAATGATVFMILRRREADQKIKTLREKWEALGHDIVVLHRSTNSNQFVGLSPFDLKLETYLRVAGIRYYRDTSLAALASSQDYNGQPWITVEGDKDLFGSQACIDYLSKRYDNDPSLHLTSEEKAISRCTRVLAEEHLFKLLTAQNYVSNCTKEKGWNLEYVNTGDIQRACIEDLQAVSTILSDKDFIVGDHGPTDLDSTVFAFIMAIEDSPSDSCMLKPLLERRLTNLDQHSKRIKAKYYSDWDDIWHDGEYHVIVDHSALKNSVSIENSIKSQDDSEEDEKAPQLEEESCNTANNITEPTVTSKHASKGHNTQTKQSNPINAEPSKPVTATNTASLANNKFLKQIASAEQNVKKLLGSPPKKQGTQIKTSTPSLSSTKKK